MSVETGKRADVLDQLTTFVVGAETFGVEVTRVQEVTGIHEIVPVPLAPPFVKGLVNLRGQIATAIGLRELLNPKEESEISSWMSVICRSDGMAVSLIVDSIGEVIEVERSRFESPPDSIPSSIRHLIKGIYKLDDRILSLIDLDGVLKDVSMDRDS